MKLEAELILIHSFTIVRFAQSKHLFASSSSHLEPLDHALCSNRVIACEDGFTIFETSNNRLNIIAAKATFKERVGDQIAESCRFHWFVLFEGVQVNSVLHLCSTMVTQVIYNVWTSVARPLSPMMILSCILKTRWNLLDTVSICLPRRLSVAMPTHPLPTIPTILPPLYSSAMILLQKIFKQYMFESKVTAASRLSGYRFGEISSVASVASVHSTTSNPVSNVPGFTPILCPSHPSYAITNICKSEGCIEPLCPECITKHIRLHEQSKRPAKIDTLVTARLDCIQRVAEQKFYAQGDLEKLQSLYQVSPETLREEMQSKLTAAKARLLRLVDKLFTKMSQSVQAIYSASLYQNEKTESEFRKIASPTIDYLNTINNYKGELESDDFIPALIEVLSNFPKRPEVRPTRNKIQSLGSVDIDEKAMEDVQKAIDKFVRVQFNGKEQRTVSLMNSTSNNTKFSRIGLERSRSNQSRMLVSQVQVLTTSRPPPVPTYQRSSSSRVLPITVESLVISPYRVIQQSITRDLNIRISQPNYFKSNTAPIVWFQDNSNHYYRADINHLDQGFQRIDISLKIPQHHRSLVTPNGDIYLLGGRHQSQTTNKVYILKDSFYEQQPKMITERASFGCCFNTDSIYVVGGITSNSEAVTSKFQKYDVNKRCWIALRGCADANYGSELASFNHTVIMVGGKVDKRVSGEKGASITTNRLEIYNIANDSWCHLAVEVPIWEVPSSPGLVQITQNDFFVFGGTIGDRKSSDCIRMEFRQGVVRLTRCAQLYSESTFSNPTLIHKQQIIALQNSGRGTAKHLLRFSGQAWKFISC